MRLLQTGNMNIDSFYTYLEHPELLNKQSLVELSEINERYPFFQTSRVLFLKNLHLLNDYRYSDELKKVSLYAANRQILYNLIHDIQNNVTETGENINYTDEPVTEENLFYNEIDKIETPVNEITVNAEPEITTIITGQTQNGIIEEKPVETKHPEKIIEESDNVIQKPDVITEEVKSVAAESEVPDSVEKPEIIIPEGELKIDVTETEPGELIIHEEQIKEEKQSEISEVIDQNTELITNVNVPEEIEVEEIISEENISIPDPETETIISVPEEKTVEIKTEPLSEIIVLPVADKPEEKNNVEVPTESIADIILRKVAEIRQSRKEPFKEFVHPVIEKKTAIENEQAAVELNPEEKIVAPVEVKIPDKETVFENSVIEVSADEEIKITETIRIADEPVINEILPITEPETIVNAVTDEIRKEYPEEAASENITLTATEESEPAKEEDIIEKITEEETQIQQMELQEINEPVFTPPVYDISLLLKDMPAEPEPPEIKDISVMTLSFSQWLDYISQEKKPVKKSAKFPDLIEDFLEKQPKISIKNDGFKAVENTGDEQFDDLYISEPLADILLAQGHLARAISMYEKLALKYPEKNLYFASRIMEINNQNNQQ